MANSVLIGASTVRESNIDGFALVHGDDFLLTAGALQDENFLALGCGECDIAIRGLGPIYGAVIGSLLIAAGGGCVGSDGWRRSQRGR